MMLVLGRRVVPLFMLDKCDPETTRRVIIWAVSVNICERYVTVAAGLGRALCLFSRKKLSLTEFNPFFSETSKTLILFFLTPAGHQGP
jgi:hypothetical protein